MSNLREAIESMKHGMGPLREVKLEKGNPEWDRFLGECYSKCRAILEESSCRILLEEALSEIFGNKGHISEVEWSTGLKNLLVIRNSLTTATYIGVGLVLTSEKAKNEIQLRGDAYMGIERLGETSLPVLSIQCSTKEKKFLGIRGPWIPSTSGLTETSIAPVHKIWQDQVAVRKAIARVLIERKII